MSKFVPQASKGCIRVFKGREHLTPYWLVRYQGKQRLEHRLVMTLYLGRELLRTEIVHHKDGNGLNNAIVNLELANPHDHNAMHGKMKWSLKEAVKLREKGWTFKRLAKRYDRSFVAVNKALARRGVSTVNKRWGVYSWPVELAVKEYLNGDSCRTVGVRHNFTPMLLKKVLVRRGLYRSRPCKA